MVDLRTSARLGGLRLDDLGPHFNSAQSALSRGLAASVRRRRPRVKPCRAGASRGRRGGYSPLMEKTLSREEREVHLPDPSFERWLRHMAGALKIRRLRDGDAMPGSQIGNERSRWLLDAGTDPELSASLNRDAIRLAKFERSETVGSRAPEGDPSLPRDLELNAHAHRNQGLNQNRVLDIAPSHRGARCNSCNLQAITPNP